MSRAVLRSDLVVDQDWRSDGDGNIYEIKYRHGNEIVFKQQNIGGLTVFSAYGFVRKYAHTLISGPTPASWAEPERPKVVYCELNWYDPSGVWFDFRDRRYSYCNETGDLIAESYRLSGYCHTHIGSVYGMPYIDGLDHPKLRYAKLTYDPEVTP